MEAEKINNVIETLKALGYQETLTTLQKEIDEHNSNHQSTLKCISTLNNELKTHTPSMLSTLMPIEDCASTIQAPLTPPPICVNLFPSHSPSTQQSYPCNNNNSSQSTKRLFNVPRTFSTDGRKHNARTNSRPSFDIIPFTDGELNELDNSQHLNQKENIDVDDDHDDITFSPRDYENDGLVDDNATGLFFNMTSQMHNSDNNAQNAGDLKKQSSLPRVNSLSESQEIPEAANSVKSEKTEEEEEHESQHRSPFADFVFIKPNPTSESCNKDDVESSMRESEDSTSLVQRPEERQVINNSELVNSKQKKQTKNNIDNFCFTPTPMTPEYNEKPNSIKNWHSFNTRYSVSSVELNSMEENEGKETAKSSDWAAFLVANSLSSSIQNSSQCSLDISSPSSVGNGTGPRFGPDTKRVSLKIKDEGNALNGDGIKFGRMSSSNHLDTAVRTSYTYSDQFIEEYYEIIDLKVYHKRNHTGFESSKDLYVEPGDVIAGRYQVHKIVGSAVFSTAIQATDLKTKEMVCLKMIKNNKDYFDQSLDEIKLLKYLNGKDSEHEKAIVRMYDYFYYREHLFIVFELLKKNLHEVQKASLKSCRSITSPNYYFNMNRIQSIAKMVLNALEFMHSLDIIHADLKPENILFSSCTDCTVRVIDFGSSCFITDYLGTYVQSRSYRAPEVVLGCGYSHKIDIWSFGCILAELDSGHVLFQSENRADLIARMESVRGPVPSWMIEAGHFGKELYTTSHKIYRKNNNTSDYEVLKPSPINLEKCMRNTDNDFLDFVSLCLTIDPNERPSASDLLNHHWLTNDYHSSPLQFSGLDRGRTMSHGDIDFIKNKLMK